LNNLYESGSGIENKVLSMIDVFEAATVDYPSMILYGEDLYFLEPIVYKLSGMLSDMLIILPISSDGKISASKQLGFIKARSNKASIIDKSNSTSQSPFAYFSSETISRVIFKTSSNSSIKV
jgi:hypothetical protein